MIQAYSSLAFAIRLLFCSFGGAATSGGVAAGFLLANNGGDVVVYSEGRRRMPAVVAIDCRRRRGRTPPFAALGTEEEESRQQQFPFPTSSSSSSSSSADGQQEGDAALSPATLAAKKADSSRWDVETYVVPRYFDGEVVDEGGGSAPGGGGTNSFGGSYPSPLHSIHVVRNFLSDEEARKCLALANDHAAATGCWDRPDSDRHSTYPTCDFPIDDGSSCAELRSYLRDELDFDGRVFAALGHMFGVPRDAMSYLDFFCAHYRAKEEEEGQGGGDDLDDPRLAVMDRLEEHRDGSLLSFTVLLMPPENFDGGGTFFDALWRDGKADEPMMTGGVVRPSRAGDACLHSGKLLHGADVVTRGERTVLVGFVDVDGWCIAPNALSRACRDWGRMDVALKRHERQQLKTGSGGSTGWFFNNERWLSSGNSSAIRWGYCPAFTSVSRRADKSFQRRKKLEAEDVLLRTILHPDRHKRDKRDKFFSDITVL